MRGLNRASRSGNSTEPADVPRYFLKAFAAIKRVRRIIVHEAIEIDVLRPKIFHVLDYAPQHFSAEALALSAAVDGDQIDVSERRLAIQSAARHRLNTLICFTDEYDLGVENILEPRLPACPPIDPIKRPDLVI